MSHFRYNFEVVLDLPSRPPPIGLLRTMLRRRACLCALLAIVAAVPGDRPLRGSRQRDYSRRNLFGNIFGGGSAAATAAPTAAIPATTDGFDPASNVCLLTIMTQERTASLHRMLGVWDGYVSIALLVDVYDEAAAEGINLLKYHGELPRAPQRITLSIVEDRGYRSPYNRFPYNVLRNVALEGCTAEYVMAADVDFVPFSSIGTSPSANLRRSLNELNVRDGAKNVLVLAAFEEVDARQGIDSREGKPSVLLANGTGSSSSSSSSSSGGGGRRLSSRSDHLDKAELLRRVRNGQIVGFASREYDAGHRCDHVSTFLTTSNSYRVEYVRQQQHSSSTAIPFSPSIPPSLLHTAGTSSAASLIRYCRDRWRIRMRSALLAMVRIACLGIMSSRRGGRSFMCLRMPSSSTSTLRMSRRYVCMLAAAHQHQKNASLRVSVCALSRALTSYFPFFFVFSYACTGGQEAQEEVRPLPKRLDVRRVLLARLPRPRATAVQLFAIHLPSDHNRWAASRQVRAVCGRGGEALRTAVLYTADHDRLLPQRAEHADVNRQAGDTSIAAPASTIVARGLGRGGRGGRPAHHLPWAQVSDVRL